MRLSIAASRQTLVCSWSVTFLESTARDKGIFLQVRLHACVCILGLALHYHSIVIKTCR